MTHKRDTQERMFTDHPGSKTPRYASEVPGQTSRLKDKNRPKWRRRKRAHKRREQNRLRSAYAQHLSPEDEAAMVVAAQFDALMEDE